MRVLAPVTTFDGTLRLEMKKARLLHCHPFCLHIFIYGLQGKHPLRLTEFDDKIALVNDRKTSATSLEPKAVRYSQWIRNHDKINCHGTRPREQLRQSISTFRKHPLCVRDYQRQRFQMIVVHPETALALQKRRVSFLGRWFAGQERISEKKNSKNIEDGIQEEDLHWNHKRYVFITREWLFGNGNI